MTEMQIGALMPHFGSFATKELLKDVAVAAHEHGLDSLWVRDHLTYGPHGMEDPDPTFLETFTTLGYAAAHAPGLGLGTAAIIPVRHPLMLAKSAASLAALTDGPLKLGIGAGFRDREFAAVGLHANLSERVDHVVPVMFEVLRAMRAGEAVEYHGTYWDFGRTEQWPVLPPQTRLLYCGTSPRALRLSLEHAEGWVPGRITVPTLKRRLETVSPDRDLDVVAIPLVVVAQSKEEAAALLDLESLLEYANEHKWLDRPAGGTFETADDLEGIVLHGTVDDVAAGIERLRSAGATEVVLDLRLSWAGAPDLIGQLGSAIGRTKWSAKDGA
ncbi:MAG: Luciferase-like, subgroup [Rhodoglobus sp.]|nr:Luciferase-like, subgroup [Rhodoglobus sp.]